MRLPLLAFTSLVFCVAVKKLFLPEGRSLSIPLQYPAGIMQRLFPAERCLIPVYELDKLRTSRS